MNSSTKSTSENSVTPLRTGLSSPGAAASRPPRRNETMRPPAQLIEAIRASQVKRGKKPTRRSL